MAELYHLGLEAGEVPGRAVIVEHGLDSTSLTASLADAGKVVAKREFRSTTGSVSAQRVVIVAAGIGGPSTAIALEELLRAGARQVVWIGRRRDPAPTPSAGVMVPAGAIRSDGTSAQYAPMAYPALPDFGLSDGLRTALGGTRLPSLVETTDVLSPSPSTAQDLCSAALFVIGASHAAAVASVLLPGTAVEVGPEVAAAVLSALVPGIGGEPT